jgi:hypothetical protein
MASNFGPMPVSSFGCRHFPKIQPNQPIFAPKSCAPEAERLTYSETSNMMRGLADDYLRIADIAEAVAAIHRVLYGWGDVRASA